MILSLAFTLAAAGDVAVVVRRAGADPVALQARCALHVTCASQERVDAAVKDAQSLGIECDVDDADCWRRFLAAEPDLGVVVVVGDAAVVAVSSARVDMRALPPGADAAPVVDALLAPAIDPAPVVIVAPSPPAPIVAARPPLLLWSLAGGAGALSLAAGVTSLALSAALANDLDAAERGDKPLDDYEVRDGAVIGLGVAAGALGATAVVALVLAGLE